MEKEAPKVDVELAKTARLDYERDFPEKSAILYALSIGF